MTQEGLCCFIQRYCEHFNIVQTSSKELSAKIGMTKQRVAWCLRELGWEAILSKTDPFYIWKKNGSEKEFVRAAQGYATRQLRRLIEE